MTPAIPDTTDSEAMVLSNDAVTFALSDNLFANLNPRKFVLASYRKAAYVCCTPRKQHDVGLVYN